MTTYEKELVDRMKVEWAPDRDMPVHMQMVKIQPISDGAKSILASLAAAYGMTITFGILNEKHFVEVKRPRA